MDEFVPVFINLPYLMRLQSSQVGRSITSNSTVHFAINLLSVALIEKQTLTYELFCVPKKSLTTW